MNPPESRSPLSVPEFRDGIAPPQLLTMQLIHVALAAGVILFTAVILIVVFATMPTREGLARLYADRFLSRG
jgi:hypothetical protein